jgi:hypothetical protein
MMSDEPAHDPHAREDLRVADPQELVRASAADPIAEPIIIDVGKRPRRLIEQLARGEGPLMEEMQAFLDDVRAELGGELDGKVLVPVVVVCRPKRRRWLRIFPAP